mgnify:CR=1 FL=1
MTSGGLGKDLPIRCMTTALTLLVTFSVSVSAQDYDPVKRGHELVTMHCANCHATGATGTSPFPTAPLFRDLHLRYDVELLSEALVEGIVTAHPEMPQFEFDPDQAAAIIAYLKTLEPRTENPPGLKP